MALISKFNIGNYSLDSENSQVVPTNTFNVVSYHLVTRCNDDGFHPVTVPKSEYIEIILKCNTTPMPLFKWYRSNNAINGCINVSIPDGDNTRNRMIVFEGAQCFFFNEKYKFNEPQHQVTLRIAVDRLSVENNVYKRI